VNLRRDHFHNKYREGGGGRSRGGVCRQKAKAAPGHTHTLSLPTTTKTRELLVFGWGADRRFASSTKKPRSFLSTFSKDPKLDTELNLYNQKQL